MGLTRAGSSLYFLGRRRHDRPRVVEERRHRRRHRAGEGRAPRSDRAAGLPPPDGPAADGSLYFAATDGTNSGLWRTDGTAAGTVFVAGNDQRVFGVSQLVASGPPSTSPTTSAPSSRPTRPPRATRWRSSSRSTPPCWRWSTSTAASSSRARGRPVLGEPQRRRLAPRPPVRPDERGLQLAAGPGQRRRQPVLQRDQRDERPRTVLAPPHVARHVDGERRRRRRPSSSPANITNVAGQAYFTTGSDASGYQLWRSNGTAAGTTFVDTLNPGGRDSEPTDLSTVGTRLFLTNADPAAGREVWTSDGTAPGTRC